MSILGAMSTAVSGLKSQAAAFSDISDNVANSQTVGFKRIDTTFEDYLTTSTAATNDSGAVAARPEYVNTVQGTITQTDNPLAMAISGQGFFSVSLLAGTDQGGNTVFAKQGQFTREGDFQLDKGGRLVNASGEYLNGWPVSAAGITNTSSLQPIEVSQAATRPIETTQVNLSANLPPAAGTTTPQSSPVTIYDAQGQAHEVTLTFTPQAAANTWQLGVVDDSGHTIANTPVTFGADGTIASVGSGAGAITTAGAAATITLATQYPDNAGMQSIKLSLGSIGATTGLTQFAGNAYTLRSIDQNGVPPGSFSSVTTTASGDIVVNYDNGQSRTIAQVPITTFAAPDSLQRQNGSAFTATTASGAPVTQAAGASGAGGIATSSTEASNVDISQEFSQLVIAQRAYSANAKIITTADDLLQQTIDIKR